MRTSSLSRPSSFLEPINLLVAALLFCLAPPVATKAEERPNLIFLLTDDQRDNTFGAMGHSFVKTPHVDELLSKSVRFRNTYIAEPVCSPSRVSYFTGVHEKVHGVGFTSSYQLTESQWEGTYAARLREAGYHTGFVGKFGLEYYTFKGNAAEKFDYWWGHDGWTRFEPKKTKSPSTLPYHEARENLITPIMGEAIGDFLDQAPNDRPFSLSVSFNVPHGSQAQSMFADYPDWRKLGRPANENADLQGHPFYDNLYREIEITLPPDTATNPYRFIPQFIMAQDKGRADAVYAYNYTIESNREHHIRYYQMISGLDHEIGRIIDRLETDGLLDNTVILYGSDHGLLMGEYGMGGKALLYDLASKIPCFVFDPRAPDSEQGTTRDELVSSLDIPVTILDYAGVEVPSHMYGRSLKPLVRGEEVAWREELFLESLYTGRDTPFQEGMRTTKWKYIRMFDAPGKILHTTEKGGYVDEDIDFTGRVPDFEMLFNLAADPGERENLIEKMAESDILAKLRRKTSEGSADLQERRRDYLEEVEVERR
ncbi:MAG: sulfatase-like hydrolase/transferase [Verrucomicrobiota bacterium]